MQTKPDPLAPLRPVGAVLNPDMVQATYAVITPLAAMLDPTLTEARYDVAYGPHPRHRLDVYRPAAGPAPSVLVVYVHGGGFQGGDKGGEGKPFFANVGVWATGLGMAAAAMTYRLLPDAAWPSGGEDVAAAVACLEREAAALGASPRIVLAGQSAGAVAVAEYLAGQAGPVSPAVSGAVLMSGVYDFTRHDRRSFEDAYFGADAARFAAQSTLPALAALDLPLMFTVSELDPPIFQRQAAHVVEQSFARAGRFPELQYLAGHNHISAAPLIGSEVDRVGPLIEDFIARLPD